MIKSAVGALQIAATALYPQHPQFPSGTQHGSGIAKMPQEEEVKGGDVVEEPPLP